MILIRLKKQNRLRKEINRLLSKGLILIKTFLKLRFSVFKNQVSFWGAQTHADIIEL